MNKIVETKYGKVEGFEENGLLKFLGIPYAAQPRGELRWKRARECARWDGILRADHYGDVAFQDDKEMEQGSDDCLSISVVRPKEGEKLPVFVWIHESGYMIGSASDTLYHGDSFAQDGVIYVNFQYRLNVIGFYDFSTYAGCDKIETNRGLSDMILALKWVHENIAAFGGDPERVTIGGESAGGAAVVTLMAVPSVRGYFQQVIAESALCNCVMTPQIQRKNVDLFLEGMGWDETNLYEKLMQADPFEMIRAARYQERVFRIRGRWWSRCLCKTETRTATRLSKLTTMIRRRRRSTAMRSCISARIMCGRCRPSRWRTHSGSMPIHGCIALSSCHALRERPGCLSPTHLSFRACSV